MSTFEDYMKAQGYNPDLTMVCSNFGPEDMRGAFEAGRQAARAGAAPAGTGAPGTLRSELEATVRIWREESQPYPDEDPEDTARRGGFGYCADELAQVLAKHPATQAAPDPDGQQRYVDELHDLIRDILVDYVGDPSAGSAEYWRRAGQLYVHDADGRPLGAHL